MRDNGFTVISGRWVLSLAAVLLAGVLCVGIVSAQDQLAPTVGAELVAEGLTSPVLFVTANDGSGRYFVVDQVGQVRIITSDGQLLPDPFIDVSDQLVAFREGYDERGLLGLAFHPDYAANGRFFLYYTAPLRPEAPPDWDHTNVVAEYTVSADDPNRADSATQRIIFQLDHPSFNHDAGHIAFGPDGYLYIPMGDGGGADDTGLGHTPDIGNGQDTTNLHGAILRIDVNTADSGEAYTIPADNPFVGEDNVADEIYAYGFRNPYDIYFSQDGQLFAADAGQNLYEEISIVQAGGNYGWNIKEGTHCFNPADASNPPAECPNTGANGEPLIDPVIEYGHDTGIVVVGGRMYRGSALPDFAEQFIFADYLSISGQVTGLPTGALFRATPTGDGSLWPWELLTVSGTDGSTFQGFILGLGEDASGEIIVLTNENSALQGATGKVWRLVPAA